VEKGRVIEQLGEASEGEVGAKRSYMVHNGVENEVHSTFMQVAAELFQAIGVAKMWIQGIGLIRPVTGAHCKPSTWHKKETACALVIGFALGSGTLEIGRQVRPIRCRNPCLNTV